MTNITVISATWNRAELLDNALYAYSKQVLPKGLTWEYILVDDMSTDNTAEVAGKWAKKGLPLVYTTSEELGLPKTPGEWRDGCPLVNRASTLSNAEFLILTHPEILVPPDALFETYKKGMKSGEKRWWVTAIPYWLPKGTLAKGWKTDIWKLKGMKNFYDPSWSGDTPVTGAIDYRNQNQEIRDTWESWVFNGIQMRDWRWFGGFQEFKQWGSVDIDQANRRRAAKIETVFPTSSSSPHQKGYLMVYHQHHESKRDGDLALKGVEGMGYSDAESARKVGGLYNIYYHGERERAHDGALAGVLGDHVARYEFAASYALNKTVLDVPCGTGYGARVMRDVVGMYTGIDIDTEAIGWAEKNYSSEFKGFRTGDMSKHIPVMNEIYDMLVSFEGLEHIDDKAAFVNEMYRVLKPGGTFIVSTPNPANAPGTYWDKYMIAPEDLLNLFMDGRWANLDKFHQVSYGINKVPVKSGWNTKAQITILGGTKV
jgi:SAM-dependent methyltransferase